MSTDHSMLTMMLCGPVTGDAKNDFSLFKQYQEKLNKEGIAVTNTLETIKACWQANPNMDKPELSHLSDNKWRWFASLKFCIDQLVFYDALYLIPGWNKNFFSIALCFAAQGLGLKLLTHDNQGNLSVVAGIFFNSEGSSGTESANFRSDGEDPDFLVDIEKYGEVKKSPKEIKDQNWFERQFGL